MVAFTAVALAAQLAIVNSDQVVLRAAPSAQAAQQAVLWQGDSLEVRGRRNDYLQVWDHRRERGGFLRATQVRLHDLTPATADDLLAVLRFLRDSPGSEAQGIAYVAAYLKAAPAERVQADGAEVFDILGQLAERLARRANATRARSDGTVSAHVELAAAYGVLMRTIDRTAAGGGMTLCYDGDAHRQVLVRSATPAQRGRAALGLTRHECIDPALPALERQLLDRWRAELLDRLDLTELPEHERNRVRLRQAAVWSTLAQQSARRGEDATGWGQKALDAFALVRRADLSESDLPEYAETAVRVGASRWAAEPSPVAPPARAGLNVTTRPGLQPGETCVQLVDARQQKKVHAERCTYGVPWTASFMANAQGSVAALAVQPLPAWRELWLFAKTPQGWRIDVLPPGVDAPDVGYLEAAGFSADGTRLLAARETVSDGRHRRSFEVIKLSTLAVERRADSPDALSAFAKGQSAQWKRVTVSLR
jgi:hypothetical protein